MNAKAKASRSARWLIAAAAFWASAAEAANPAYLNVDVTIISNLSVAVNGSGSSTHTVTWNTGTPNQQFVASATSTVTNDSGGQTEKWALSTSASSIDTTGGGETWSRAASTTSVGADQFAVQAVFGSSNTAAGGCPAAGAAVWNSGATAPPLTAANQTYTDTLFADPALNSDGTPQPDDTAGAANGRMFSNSRRALCWRVITPLTTGTVHQQNIQLIVTAQNP